MIKILNYYEKNLPEIKFIKINLRVLQSHRGRERDKSL